MSTETTLNTQQSEIDENESRRGQKRTLEESSSEIASSDYKNITEMDLELKEFKCPRCDLIFETTNDLFVHMRETYSDPTVCQLCGKNLNCMANILSHSYLHQGIKPYKCPKCKYATRTRFNLRVHFGSCAKIEKFSYKRGNRARTSYKKKNDFIVNDNNMDERVASNGGNINTLHMNMYDDLLNQLPDSGPITSHNRDITCLVQVHIQHFPRSTSANATDKFYQKQLPPQPLQNAVMDTTDISQFYPSVSNEVTPSQNKQPQQWQMSSFNASKQQQLHP